MRSTDVSTSEIEKIQFSKGKLLAVPSNPELYANMCTDTYQFLFRKEIDCFKRNFRYLSEL